LSTPRSRRRWFAGPGSRSIYRRLSCGKATITRSTASNIVSRDFWSSPSPIPGSTRT
jgi:hypothetical protein